MRADLSDAFGQKWSALRLVIRGIGSSGESAECVESELFGTIPLDFLVRGEEHPCPYLPGREAREEGFMADSFPPELYHDFMNHGFRRSGLILYRPACENCSECRPIRVPADRFTPSKSQRRVVRKNEDVDVKIAAPRITREKLRICGKYIQSHHRSSPPDSSQGLKRFLYQSPVMTLEFEYRVRGRLVAVGITDVCYRSLSSVYVFYDPECSSRSLGTFSAMREVLFCREHSIPYYYLGFYVAQCPSMNYKARFRPHEILSASGNWVPHCDPDALSDK